MKKITFYIILNLALLITPWSSVYAEEGPKAVFPETRFNFRSVRQGAAMEHEYILRNEGNAPLRITGVQASPFLLPGRMSAQIAPGVEIRIPVQLDTSKIAGIYSGTLIIELNDPLLAKAVLSFEGRVIPPIELSPRPMFIVAGQRGEHRESAIEIINNGPDPLKVESVEHPRERFTTKLETVVYGKRYRLTLMLNPDGPGGKGADKITIKTSSPSRPVLTIMANTFLRERVYTFPDEVDLGSLRLAEIEADPGLLQRMAQTLMLYQAGGVDFQAKLRTDLPMLEINSKRGPKGDRFQSTISFVAAKLQSGQIEGSIIIETNDPEFPNLTIPVRGEIQ